MTGYSSQSTISVGYQEMENYVGDPYHSHLTDNQLQQLSDINSSRVTYYSSLQGPVGLISDTMSAIGGLPGAAQFAAGIVGIMYGDRYREITSELELAVRLRDYADAQLH